MYYLLVLLCSLSYLAGTLVAEPLLLLEQMGKGYKLTTTKFIDDKNLEDDILANVPAILHDLPTKSFSCLLEYYNESPYFMLRECTYSECPFSRMQHPAIRSAAEQYIATDFKDTFPDIAGHYSIAEFGPGKLLQTLLILLRLKHAGYEHLDIYLIEKEWKDILVAKQFYTTQLANKYASDKLATIAQLAQLRNFFPDTWNFYLYSTIADVPQERIFDMLYGIDYKDPEYRYTTPADFEELMLKQLKLYHKAYSLADIISGAYQLTVLSPIQEIPDDMLQAYKNAKKQVGLLWQAQEQTAVITDNPDIEILMQSGIVASDRLKKTYLNYNRSGNFAQASSLDLWAEKSYIAFNS